MTLPYPSNSPAARQRRGICAECGAPRSIGEHFPHSGDVHAREPQRQVTLADVRQHAADIEWCVVLAFWPPRFVKIMLRPAVDAALRAGHVPPVYGMEWLAVAREWRDAGFSPDLFLELHREVRRQGVLLQEDGGEAAAPRFDQTLPLAPRRRIPGLAAVMPLEDAVAHLVAKQAVQTS